MSIKVIQWVWDCSESKNAERLVLLAIADNAADDGSHAYPSLTELQRKANLSERAVRDALRRLEARGELVTHIGGGRGGTNYYTVIMKPCAQQKGADSAPAKVVSPEESAGGEGQNLPGKGAESAPGTVLEPSLEPSSSSDADASPNAGEIVGGFIDWLAARPEPIKLTPSVIARYGRMIKALLQAHYDVGTIKRALALQTERGKAGWPSMLDSFCVEVQNRPVSAPPSSKPFVQQADEYKAAKQNRDDQVLELMQQLMDFTRREHGKEMAPAEARKLVNVWIDSGAINLNDLSSSVPSLYSGYNVITAEVEEVA